MPWRNQPHHALQVLQELLHSLRHFGLMDPFYRGISTLWGGFWFGFFGVVCLSVWFGLFCHTADATSVHCSCWRHVHLFLDFTEQGFLINSSGYLGAHKGGLWVAPMETIFTKHSLIWKWCFVSSLIFFWSSEQMFMLNIIHCYSSRPLVKDLLQVYTASCPHPCAPWLPECREDTPILKSG